MTRVTDNQHKMRKAAKLEFIPKQERKFEEKQRKNRVQPARKRAKTEGGQRGGGEGGSQCGEPFGLRDRERHETSHR